VGRRRGHSWGAHLGLLTVLEHPESTAAVVYVSGTGPPTWWRSTGSALYHAERRGRLLPEMVSRLAELKALRRNSAQEVEFRRLSWITDFADVISPPDELETMASARYPINWEVNQRLVADAESLDKGRLVTACERSAVPVLLIHGSKDPRPSQGARLLADRLPNAHFVEIEGAGHLPWVERPAAVSTVIS